MTALEIRLIGYSILALCVIGVASYATHRLDNARYEALEAQYAKYQAQVEKDAATAQQNARDAIQAQIVARTAQEAANAKTVASITARADAAQRDADFANRLLESAIKTGAAATGHQVPAAGDKSGAHDGAASDGDQPLAQEIGAAAGECRQAIEQLSALQVELAPQLRISP